MTSTPGSVSGARVAERRFSFRGATPVRVGLRFGTTIHFDQWVEIGRRVHAHEDASLWWLGDWLNYGKRMYGRRYRHGIELTGLEYQTLRNYAMVARRFELCRRRDTLSFHHHAELCALPTDEQERWLDDAERGRWTRNELRRRLRAERRQDMSATALAVRLNVEPDCRGRWLAAAAASGLPLDAWIVYTLEAAALQLLPAAV
jgi:hypothetical protein